MLHLLTHISAIRLYTPADLRPLDGRTSVLKSLQVTLYTLFPVLHHNKAIHMRVRTNMLHCHSAGIEEPWASCLCVGGEEEVSRRRSSAGPDRGHGDT